MDLLNELQYQFGTKDALEGRGRKDPGTGKIEPTLIQRGLGITTEMLEQADDAGKFNRFGDTQQGQDAKRYGVDVTAADMNNLGGLQDRIDTAKNLRTNREVLTGLGYTGDTSKYTTLGGVAGAIRTQKENNERDAYLRTQNLQYNSPQAVDERETRDRRYFDNQKMLIEDRIERRENKAAELEYQKMRDRKEDMRYNDAWNN